MSDVSDTFGLHISTFHFINVFEIDEEGIEYSTVIGSSSGKMKQQVVDFNCNGPFLFLVLPEKHNFVLLLGFCR
ncbi:hypothetical protein B4U80_14940 [Leptotrombidium deliense]|uniref:Serpin domain-containing protein n=1 Tax=Leptotrombidium deliense TaxID=299467 RepID=A0A443RYB9_9ACAR|nr:hypothetical protein B4U80_14940 [Leptotrombidium deliense]